jgi:N-acetylneuraminate synthase
MKIRIDKRFLGDYLDPYIIAEIGVNHGGDLLLAKRMINEALESGAHAVKFQTYKAENLASRHSPSYWDRKKEATTSQFELFKKYDAFTPDNYAELADYCREMKGVFLSTPFDTDAVRFLEPLVPAFKIASADITNVPLLRAVARTKKPLLISTGAATLAEIETAVQLARSCGCHQIILLHCVLNYPTPIGRAQLNMIHVLKRVFPDCLTGYSDHVIPDETLSALEAAALLGACVLEKHFTYDKSLPGNDHYHAMDKHDLKRFCVKLKLYHKLVGPRVKDLALEQTARLHARRSIVTATNIEPGEMFTEQNLTTKRPGHGISPLHWDEIVGKKAGTKIEEDRLLKWSDIHMS